jgi:hypothetical protein
MPARRERPRAPYAQDHRQNDERKPTVQRAACENAAEDSREPAKDHNNLANCAGNPLAITSAITYVKYVMYPVPNKKYEDPISSMPDEGRLRTAGAVEVLGANVTVCTV